MDASEQPNPTQPNSIMIFHTRNTQLTLTAANSSQFRGFASEDLVRVLMRECHLINQEENPPTNYYITKSTK